jgi:nitrate/nitrite transport system ATP-binding protein
MRALDFRQLTKTFPTPTGSYVVTRDFTLSVGEGEFVCLVGHSGCGKSTVLSIAAGLSTPTSGDVTLAGQPIAGPGIDRGVVFQSPSLLPWLSALDNVRLAVDQAQPAATREERIAIATRCLARVGLGAALHRKPAELSAGMQQRVGIARAFGLSPKVLLLDEPFGMLDSLTRIELQETLIALWARERTTALMVTHDVDEALLLADRIALMTNGPQARLGAVLDVPFARPRVRHEVIEHPDYYRLREEIITFLEDHAHAGGASRRPSSEPAPARVPDAIPESVQAGMEA